MPALSDLVFDDPAPAPRKLSQADIDSIKPSSQGGPPALNELVFDDDPEPIDAETANHPTKSFGQKAKVAWDILNKPAWQPLGWLGDEAVRGQEAIRNIAERDLGVSPKALDIFEAIPSPFNARTQRVGMNIADTLLFSPMTYATLGLGYASKAAEPFVNLGLGVPQLYDAYESGKQGYQDIKAGKYKEGSEAIQQSLAAGFFGITGAADSIRNVRNISKAPGKYKQALNDFDATQPIIEKAPLDPNDIVSQATELKVQDNIAENQRLAQTIDQARQVTPELQDVAPFELFNEVEPMATQSPAAPLDTIQANKDMAFFRDPEPSPVQVAPEPMPLQQAEAPVASGLEGMFQQQDASPLSPIEQASQLADDTNKVAYEQSQEKLYREKEIERRIQQMDQEPDLVYDEPEVAAIVDSKDMSQAANLSSEAKMALSNAAARIREPHARDKSSFLGGLKDWVDEFKGKGAQMTKHFLSDGGQLVKRGMQGVNEYSGMKEFAKERVDAIHDLVGQDKGSQLKVIQALQDRKNSNKYLKTVEQKKAYQQAVGLYDFFRERMGEKGVATLDDYFTHLIEGADNPEMAFNMKGVPKEISSKFFEKRKGGKEYSTDLIDVLDRYSNNMSRALAYGDMTNYYWKEFLPNIEKSGRNQNANIHQKYIKDLIDPTSGMTKKGARSMDSVKKRFYGAISFITPTAIKNLTQRHNADMLTSSGAKKLGRFVRNLGDSEINNYLDSDYGGLQSAWMDTNIPTGQSLWQQGFLGKGDKANWKYSRSLGMAEHISNTPEYKALRRQGVSEVDAFARTLADPAIRKEAMSQGEMLAAQAQYSSNAAFRPEALRTGGIKSLFTMLTRFPLGQAELYGRAMGGTKSRAYQLMMKGYGPEASIADGYVANSEVIKASKKAIKENPALKTDIEHVVKTLKKANKVLKSEINKASPLRKSKSMNEIAKMTMMNAAIGQAFLMGGNAVRGVMGLDQRNDKPFTQDIVQEAFPISGKGFDMTSPLLPRKDDTAGKYGSRLGWSQVPGVNKVNAALLGLPEAGFNKFFGIGQKKQ